MQMQATPFQCVAQIAGGVRRQQHDRRHDGANGADFRDRDLEVGEDFQQKRLELLVRFVDLVDQQHGAAGFLQRAQQWARFQELLGEEDVAEGMQLIQRRRQIVGIADDGADLVLEDLGVQ